MRQTQRSPEGPRHLSRLPRGVRPRLEGKPRTPLSSRVATRVSWSPLSGPTTSAYSAMRSVPDSDLINDYQPLDQHLSTTLPWVLLALFKNLPAMQKTWVQSLDWEDPLEKGKVSTPVFWPGEFRGLYSSLGHTTPVFLPGAKSGTRLSHFHTLLPP